MKARRSTCKDTILKWAALIPSELSDVGQVKSDTELNSLFASQSRAADNVHA